MSAATRMHRRQCHSTQNASSCVKLNYTACGACGAPRDEDRLLDVLLHNTSYVTLRQRVYERCFCSLDDLLALSRGLQAAASQPRQMAEVKSASTYSEVNRIQINLKPKTFGQMTTQDFLHIAQQTHSLIKFSKILL